MRNNGSFGHRAAAGLVTVTLLMLLGWLAFTQFQYRTVSRLIGDGHAAGVEAAWRASTDMYQLSAGIMYRELSRHPAVIDWLGAANAADEPALALTRERFISLFRPDYLRLRDEGFEILQLHRADGSVLLRFHRPEWFGDDISAVRPTVRAAHEQRRNVVGFDAGRMQPALRHVFAVNYERRLIGSVELSVPYARMIERLSGLLPGTAFALLMGREAVERADPDSRALYEAWPLHPDLFTVGGGALVGADALPTAALADSTLARLARASELSDLDLWQAPGSLSVGFGDDAVIASFIPVNGINQDAVGFVLALRAAPELALAQRRFIAQAFVGGSGIVILGAVLGLLLDIANKRKAEETRARALNTQLTSLVETIPDPVYFKDAEGRWLIANQAGLQLCDLCSVAWQGKTDRELAALRPEFAEVFERARLRDLEAIRSGMLSVYDDQIVTDGERRLFEVRKLPHMEDGRAVSLLVLRRDVTEERAAKAAVIESERRYRDVVDNIREVIFRIDGKGILTFLNPAWETLTAWTVEFALGTRSIDYVHPDDRERTRTLIRPLMKGEQDCFREVMRYLRADGGWRWVEVFAAPAIDEHGQPCGAYGTLMDVTEHRRMIDALRAERDLFAAGPVMVFVWRNEPGWPVEYVSANVIKELGYEPGQLTETSLLYADLMHPDDLPRIEQEMQCFVEGLCSNFELSYRLRDAQGRYRWFREWSVPQWDDDNAFVELRGYVIDETGTKEAQLAAELARQRQTWILEGANVGTWEWDVPRGSLIVNERWAQMLGYTVGELWPLTVGDWKEMIHPEDVARCQEKMIAHFDCESPYYEGEHRLRHKDGSWVWVLARGRVIERGADGEPQLMCGTLMDIAKRKQAEAHAAHLAYFDELTGLPNRRMLLERLRHVQLASKRAHLYSALLFIDLDNFKNLNDTLGHDYGDMLLREVARRLRDILREDDTVARLGGDEFVILLEELDPGEDEAVVRAERAVLKILTALSSPYQLDEHRHHLTPSIGVTLFRDTADSVETLMKKADLAMYQAKAAGRGTFRFFDPAMQATAERRLNLEVELRQALESGQFLLAYQPIVDAGGKVTAAEALLRWQHPQHGLISPGEFIPVAEASGLIVPLGRWVLRCACEQLARWRGCPTRGAWRMAVNVSARQFHQRDFVALVLESLSEAGADPHRLRLEITESMLLENIDETISRMSELREHGVTFALDDFGTGYSSLNYLKKLPLSVLKIDQSFVRDISTDPSDATIVQTIIAMAHSLELRVVAEGVETAEQEVFLLAHGCDALQGFHFHRPMPIAQLDQLA